MLGAWFSVYLCLSVGKLFLNVLRVDAPLVDVRAGVCQLLLRLRGGGGLGEKMRTIEDGGATGVMERKNAVCAGRPVVRPRAQPTCARRCSSSGYRAAEEVPASKPASCCD